MNNSTSWPPYPPSMDWMAEQLALLEGADNPQPVGPVRRGSEHSRVTPQQALTYEEGLTARTPSDSLRSPFRLHTPLQLDNADDMPWPDYKLGRPSQDLKVDVASLAQEVASLKVEVNSLKSKYAQEARSIRSVPEVVDYVKKLSRWFVQSKSELDQGMAEIMAVMERMRGVSKIG